MSVFRPQVTQPRFPAAPNSVLSSRALWNFGQGARDSVSGAAATLAAGYTSVVATPSGTGMAVSGTGTLGRCVLGSTVSAIAPGTGDFTVFLLFRYDGSSGGYAAIARWNSGGAAATCDWLLGAGNTFSGTTADFEVAVGSTIYTASASSASWTVGKIYLLIGRRSGTTIYVDRFDVATRSRVSGTTQNAGITNINYNVSRSTKIGEIDVGTGYNANLSPILGGTLPYALTEFGIGQIAANPWKFFQGAGNPIPLFPPVATAAASLSGQAGTGYAGTPAATAAASLSGQAGTGYAGTPAATAAASLSGQAGTGYAGTPAATAAASLSGQAGTGYAGVLSPSTSTTTTVTISGVSAIGHAGVCGPATSMGVFGQSATGYAGGLAQTSRITLHGAFSQGYAGRVRVPTVGQGPEKAPITILIAGAWVPVRRRGAYVSIRTAPSMVFSFRG